MLFRSAIRRAYIRGLNWQELRDLVDDPAITVKYHILNISTLADHIKAYYNPANLMAWDANPYLLAGRELARRLAFNTATVRFFWLPLMRRADKQAWLRHLMHDQFYRGVIFYHFLKGVTDARRLYPARLRHPNT